MKIGDITVQYITPWARLCENCNKMCTEYIAGATDSGRAAMYNLPCGCCVGPAGEPLSPATLALAVLALP